MTGLLSEDQAGAWQLISVNINRQCSANVSVIVEKKLLTLACTRAHLPFIFFIQETRSWDVLNLKLLGYVCYGSNFGLATLMVCGSVFFFFKIKRSWRFEERCTAVPFGAVLVMAVNAPDCKKDLDVFDIHLECHQNLTGRTSSRSQGFLHYWRRQCGVGAIVYRRGRHRRVQ